MRPQRMQFSFSFQRGATNREMLLNVVSNQLAAGGGTAMTPQVLVAIDQYCTVMARKPDLTYSYWPVQSMQQIVKALD